MSSARYTAINAAIVLAICAGMSWFGPSILDKDQIKRRTDIAKEQAARERFERAAQEMCGINGAWEEVRPGSIQCFTHKGRKAGKPTEIMQASND